MKVDLTKIGLEPPQNNRSARPAAGEGSVPAADAAAAGTDKIKFSFDKVRVASLRAQALEQPEIREGKVRKLQQSIQAGQYSVPASDVANAMVRDLKGE